MRAVDDLKNTALHYSATNLNYAATKVLIESNAPVEVKNSEVREGGRQVGVNVDRERGER